MVKTIFQAMGQKVDDRMLNEIIAEVDADGKEKHTAWELRSEIFT